MHKVTKKILIPVLGLMLLAAGCNKVQSPVEVTQVSGLTVEIAMTANGFNPAIITVKSGTKVVFKNTDSEGHWPASNPHPSHTDLPGFDSGQPIDNGNTYSFTFSKLGTWGFHDHLHPNLHGSVIVTP